MNKIMIGWLNEWMNEWMNDKHCKYIVQIIDIDCINRYIHQFLNRKYKYESNMQTQYGIMNERMNECMNKSTALM